MSMFDDLAAQYSALPSWAQIGIPVAGLGGIAYIALHKGSSTSTVAGPGVSAGASNGGAGASAGSSTPADNSVPITSSPGGGGTAISQPGPSVYQPVTQASPTTSYATPTPTAVSVGQYGNTVPMVNNPTVVQTAEQSSSAAGINSFWASQIPSLLNGGSPGTMFGTVVNDAGPTASLTGSEYVISQLGPLATQQQISTAISQINPYTGPGTTPGAYSSNADMLYSRINNLQNYLQLGPSYVTPAEKTAITNDITALQGEAIANTYSAWGSAPTATQTAALIQATPALRGYTGSTGGSLTGGTTASAGGTAASSPGPTNYAAANATLYKDIQIYQNVANPTAKQKAALATDLATYQRQGGTL